MSDFKAEMHQIQFRPKMEEGTPRVVSHPMSEILKNTLIV